jgi:hypothetical protein
MVLVRISEGFSLARLEVRGYAGLAREALSAKLSICEKAMKIAL